MCSTIAKGTVFVAALPILMPLYGTAVFCTATADMVAMGVESFHDDLRTINESWAAYQARLQARR